VSTEAASPRSPAQEAGDAEFRVAFAANEREVRIRTGKLACALVIALMPVGSIYDLAVLPPGSVLVARFFWYRILCSLAVGVVFGLHYADLGMRHYRVLQHFIVLLPAATLGWMIHKCDLESAPYYAALNLILVALSAVGHWNWRDSLVSTVIVIVVYLLAESPTLSGSVLFSNLYFLLLTGVIVLAGNRVFNELANREFLSRYELDRSRRTLEETNRKLVELDRVKNRFFANISHELRTPLTLLLAPLESLLNARTLRLDPTVLDHLQTMHANSLRLLRLINDLLDLVRLEAGKMEVRRQPVVLDDFVRGLLSAVKKVANDRRIRLTGTVATSVGRVLTDVDKLEKILLNLLFNALKFTPAGGGVEIEAWREGDELVVRVSDNGMGIPQDKQPFVFQRFWQGDVSAQRKYQGAGIGLALVKELTEIQDGRVEVESQPGLGTKFTLRLPYLPAPATPLPAAPVPAGAPSAAPAAETPPTLSGEWLAALYRRAEMQPSFGLLQNSVRPVPAGLRANLPRLLIADDEPDMLRFLKEQLLADFEVLEAVDGEQALALAAQFLPEAVLCDMMMPEKDGLTVCRQLRQRTATKSIPVLLITARADEETKLAALEAGANDFLTKPFSMTELRVRLRNLVNGSRLQRQLTRQNQTLESTLTQLKETETQLVSAEKMASLGRLSAGLMHEVSNPLNFMKTTVHVLRTRAAAIPDGARKEFVEILTDMDDGLARVQGIVGDLRRFAHPDPSMREGVRVEEVVAVALRFLGHELGDGVKLETALEPAHAVFANRNQLVHVLINLLQNSLYAVRRKAYPPDEGPRVWIESAADRDVDRLVVRDNGPGVRAEHLDKLFEPFFTTKEVGEGVGLGLSICYRIVEQHHGRIAVDSRPGEFCRFTIELPRRTESRRSPA
jgi:signal transduction histidine kinase